MDDITLRGAVFAGQSYWTSKCATWPFGLLTVSPTHLIVALRSLFIPFRYDFPKEMIQKLVVRQRTFIPGVPTAGLEIAHNLPDVPPYIRFGTFAPDRLVTALKSAGYELSMA